MKELRKCIECGKEFIASQKKSIACSKHCQHKVRKRKQLKNSTGPIVCKICGARFNGKIVAHVNSLHNMSLKEYQEQTGATKEECFSKKYLDKNIGFKSGEDNPGYKHGGKLSSWSKKSKYYSEESIEKANKNRSYDTRLDYWLEKTGGDIDLANELLLKRQTTFSKKICIEKYGKEKGLKKFNERQRIWQQTLMNKDPEEIDRINKAKMNKGYNVSKVELNLYNELLKINEKLQSQKTISNKIYDIVDIEHKKIIEFNGIFWHCKPGIYDADFVHPIMKKTAQEIWNKDKKKKKIANDAGYELLIIWEDDFNENRKETIKQCQKFFDQVS